MGPLIFHPMSTADTNNDGSACPVCGELTRLKISGRGKHFGHICARHGIVRITRHPLCPMPTPKRGVLQRLRDWLLGPMEGTP